MRSRQSRPSRSRVGAVSESAKENILRLVYNNGERTFRADHEGNLVRRLTNLGWLLKNWKSVKEFDIAPLIHPRGRDVGDVLMIAELYDGTFYVSDWASRSVMMDWLNRPAFKGVSVQWNLPRELGEAQVNQWGLPPLTGSTAQVERALVYRELAAQALEKIKSSLEAHLDQKRANRSSAQVEMMREIAYHRIGELYATLQEMMEASDWVKARGSRLPWEHRNLFERFVSTADNVVLPFVRPLDVLLSRAEGYTDGGVEAAYHELKAKVGMARIGAFAPFELKSQKRNPTAQQILILKAFAPELAEPYESLLQMYRLEDPTIPMNLEIHPASHGGLLDALQLLSPKDKRLFTADCIEAVLPYFEEMFPGESRPRQALEEIRASTRGKSASAALKHAKDLLNEAANEVRPRMSAADGVLSALHEATDPDADKAIHHGRHAAFNTEISRVHYDGPRDAAYKRSEETQRRLLLPYLSGEKKGKKSKIGGIKEENAIRTLAKRDPIAAISSPDCPTELWWELATRYPRQAIASPLYPLMTLATPDLWQRIEESYARGFDHELGLISERNQTLLAADYVEHVLHLFESIYPKDRRPRLAIECVRLPRCSQSLRNQRRLHAHNAYVQSQAVEGKSERKTAASTVAYAATEALSCDVTSVAQECRNAVSTVRGWDAEKEEALWQLRRLWAYPEDEEIVSSSGR